MLGNVTDEPVLTSPKRHFATIDVDRLFSTSSFRYVQTIMAIYFELFFKVTEGLKMESQYR